MGYFKEDYQFNVPTASLEDFPDEHNGRFCITPEYPNGMYCFFATVDANWNSTYPYVAGPTFYSVKSASKVTSITETVSTYTPSNTSLNNNENDTSKINVFPNPAKDFVSIELNHLTKNNIEILKKKKSKELVLNFI